MFKIKNLFFLIVFIVGCDPSSNSQKKDIDLSGISSYDYTLEDSWVKSNCNIVAYVYDNSNKEILQVEKIHLTD